MLLKEFNFNVPQELIAQEPLVKRGDARLLIFDKKTGSVTHDVFSNLARYLQSGDCLVLNNTKVIPARIFGAKITGGRIELLLLRSLGKNSWETLLKPGLKIYEKIYFDKNHYAEVIRNDNGIFTIQWFGKDTINSYVHKYGIMPLPPYIKRKQLSARIRKKDNAYYQTVYAKTDGSIAAPTAGLHFTKGLLDKLRNSGVKIAEVLLHVGIGTFQKINVDNITDHHMHEEYFEIDKNNAKIINTARKKDKKIIAVGTTVVRALESSVDQQGVKSTKTWTDIFISPGYRFKAIDCMVTNFHLPKGSPFIMTSSFAGLEPLKRVYKEAVDKNYRFFSYGDAMLIF